MKKIYLILATLILCVGCNQSPSFKDTAGNTIRFSDYRGKWIFINYWASWCKPCYEELPELNKFYLKHKDKDAIVLGVNYDLDKKNNIKTIIKKMNVAFPTLTTDPKAALGVNHIAGLPTTYVLTPKGEVAEVLLGKQTVKSLESFLGRA